MQAKSTSLYNIMAQITGKSYEEIFAALKSDDAKTTVEMMEPFLAQAEAIAPVDDETTILEFLRYASKAELLQDYKGLTQEVSKFLMTIVEALQVRTTRRAEHEELQKEYDAFVDYINKTNVFNTQSTDAIDDDVVILEEMIVNTDKVKPVKIKLEEQQDEQIE
ncbi:hypothetical protein L596_001890 [Steinernema carpocapsae]|uniref:Uncharacterized protein n=1 Tax=Steinernema carpocapsae TaxID=34508 RepID=A0A4U8UMU0_STECR|nr:hypothetical protein L596_001890 [Steinernema carpocapsae]